MKHLYEQNELPIRMVYVRRIALILLKRFEGLLYSHPILLIVEETTKIMLMNEFELLYWFYLMKKYLKQVRAEPGQIHEDTIRMFFFHSAMFVKRFLLQK